MFEDFEEKNRSDVRELVLKVREGQKATSGTTGLVDPRLFKGENQLFAVMDPATCMWSLKYKHGAIPEVLRTKYTKFSKLLENAKAYFSLRNIDIIEVKD